MAEAKKTVKAAVVKTIDDLKKELAEKRNDLLQAKRSHAAGELVNPKALRSLRKEIARLLTQINNTKESKVMARRTLIGVVTSAKRDKTITVTVTSRETHPLYGKQYTVTRKYTAHDETNEAGEGDKVQIEETRPISKTKSFTLVKVIEKVSRFYQTKGRSFWRN